MRHRSTTGPHTVFAPTNEASGRIPKAGPGALLKDKATAGKTAIAGLNFSRAHDGRRGGATKGATKGGTPPTQGKLF